MAPAGEPVTRPDDGRLPEPDDLVSAYPLDGDGTLGPAPGAGPYPDADTDELWDAAVAVDSPAADVADDGDGQGNRIRGFLEWGAVVVGALAVALVIKTFLMQAYFIPSESMVPTLEVGDRVLVNKLSYEFGEVGRGDLVVFNRPANQTSGEDDLIKRVIALEGETIEVRENTIFITLPGSDTPQRLEEPYLVEGMRITGLVDTSNCDNPTPTTCTIPEDHVFVMGDNRTGSRDSRAFGPIDEDLIVGRAFLRVWPLSSISFL